MKKYSTDYFEKKYKILSAKLLQKAGFIDAIRATRAELGLPENGFGSTQELAQFLIDKMSKTEQQTLTFYTFVEAYAYQHKIVVSDENRKEIVDAFFKEQGNKRMGIGMVPMMFEIANHIESHHNLIAKYPLFEQNKYLSKLYPAVTGLAGKFWGVDLLDDHITIHYIEKYLLLGQVGINQYIKSKVSCPNCKYLGIEHFSPRGVDMEGRKKGPYTKGYVFNKRAVHYQG